MALQYVLVRPNNIEFIPADYGKYFAPANITNVVSTPCPFLTVDGNSVVTSLTITMPGPVVVTITGTAVLRCGGISVVRVGDTSGAASVTDSPQHKLRSN